ncbi:GntR family transcriptional regulator [Bacillus sp. J14TS2]|uniref:GntR family transcriptional regulator n=1 Tax=Bacillus sp. J14TS2 TaxID=2807188 RepID=UPI001B0960E5|nr:GntR family transcriptional regulator [Bacillus sp. J14TS2]GIN74543.1 GntR family transcriptional regulator [Bacillus sp. J14TS2]
MTLSSHKISRVSMRNHAYELIKNAIISGELKPEMRVKDKELSEQLGISRTPVREAMLRLEDEELIVSKPNSYTMVAPINTVEAKEIYSIVIALETLAFQEALLNYTSTQLQQLEKINHQYINAIEKGNPKNCLKYDMEFHSQLVRMSNNKELEKILSKLKDKIVRIESFYFHKVIPKQKSINEHTMIIEEMRNRSFSKAGELIKNNWMNSLNNLLSEEK